MPRRWLSWTRCAPPGTRPSSRGPGRPSSSSPPGMPRPTSPATAAPDGGCCDPAYRRSGPTSCSDPRARGQPGIPTVRGLDTGRSHWDRHTDAGRRECYIDGVVAADSGPRARCQPATSPPCEPRSSPCRGHPPPPQVCRRPASRDPVGQDHWPSTTGSSFLGANRRRGEGSFVTDTTTLETASAAPRRSGSLTALKLAELQGLASSMGISGTAKMRKNDLVEAIKARQGGAGAAPVVRADRPERTDRTERPASASSPEQADRTEAGSIDRPAAGDAARTSGPVQGERRNRRAARPAGEASPNASVDVPVRFDGDGERPAREDRQQADRQQAERQQAERPPRDSRQQAERQPREDREQGERTYSDRQQDRSRQQDDRQHTDRQQGDRQPGQQPQRQQNPQTQQGQGQQGQGSQQNNAQGGFDDDADGRGGRRRRNRNRNRDKRRGGREFGEIESQDDTPIHEDDVLLPVAGILDVLDNYAFVRTSGYLPGAGDVYVPLGMVKKSGLRKGDAVTGAVRAPRDNEQPQQQQGNRQKFNPLVRLDSVNGMSIEEARKRPEFGKLTPLYPQERLRLETEPNILTTRIIDLVAPIGQDQPGLLVAPAKAGKTLILQAIANAITTNNPEVHLMVVLVDERPEEVTDMQRAVKGEVIASTFDRPAEDHTTVAELSIERAKRLVELGHDVVVLLDSITKLGRAYNLAAPASGRILSGGVDSSALYPPKRFFGAARNIEDGGSLTVLATALVETGSKMDDVIFEEFKGTGNMELKLDRKLADKRIFPAVDVDPSGTRKEEILLSPEELQIVWKLRKVLHALDSQQGMELLLSKLKDTQSNYEFLLQVQKTSPGPE